MIHAMSETGEKIRPNQRRAIEALAAGATVEQAALDADVTVRTIYSWRRENGFKCELQAATDEILSQSVTTITAGVLDAIQTLRDIQTDANNPPATRVMAARAILDASLRLREQINFQERLAALEAAVSYGQYVR